MTGPGGGAAPDRIDPQLLGELAGDIQCLHGHGPAAPNRFSHTPPCEPEPASRNQWGDAYTRRPDGIETILGFPAAST
jgi:hypothetical protein